MPQSFTVSSEPIPATPQSIASRSVGSSLSNTTDISEDSQNTEKGFFSNNKMGQIP